MLATYRSYAACWTELGAVCWQPTGLIGPVGPSLGLYVGNLGLIGPVGPSLGLYVGNLQVLCGLLDRAWGCMWATGDSLFRGLCFCVGFTTSFKERIRRIPDILCGMLIMVYLFILLIHLFTYLLIYLFTDLFIYLFMCFGASKPETNIVRPHEPSHAVLLCLARWSVRSLKTGTCSRPCSAGNDVLSNFSHHKPSPEG